MLLLALVATLYHVISHLILARLLVCRHHLDLKVYLFLCLSLINLLRHLTRVNNSLNRLISEELGLAVVDRLLLFHFIILVDTFVRYRIREHFLLVAVLNLIILIRIDFLLNLLWLLISLGRVDIRLILDLNFQRTTLNLRVVTLFVSESRRCRLFFLNLQYLIRTIDVLKLIINPVTRISWFIGSDLVRLYC